MAEEDGSEILSLITSLTNSLRQVRDAIKDQTTSLAAIADVAGGAIASHSYVTIESESALSAERVLTGTTNQITVTDGGAGGAVTLSLPDPLVLPGELKLNDDVTSLATTDLISFLGSREGGPIYDFESTGADPYGINIYLQGASPDDNTNYFLRCLDSGLTSRCFIYSDGDVQNHDNAYGPISSHLDEKENLDDAPTIIPELNKLRIRQFSHKQDNKSKADQFGVVIEEVQANRPNLGDKLLKTSRNTGRSTIYYSMLTPLLVKAVQELDTRVTGLGG